MGFLGKGFLDGAFKQPLLYFILAGAVVFLVDARLRRSVMQVNVPTTLAAEVTDAFLTTQGRPPTPEEVQKGVADWVMTELLYREALQLGLDKNDPNFRIHLATKLKNLVQRRTIIEPPTETELRAELDAHPERYTAADTYDVTIVFVARGDAQTHDARVQDALNKLRAGAPPKAVGDHFPRGPTLERVLDLHLAQILRVDLAHRLTPERRHQWQPLASERGTYLLRLDAIHSGRPEFDRVRGALAATIEQRKREAALFEFVEQLRNKYSVLEAPR